jgi:adenylate cyclase class IV
MKQDQIIKYAKYVELAARNLKENGTNVPTEEMKQIATELGMSHNDIIHKAAELITLGHQT